MIKDTSYWPGEKGPLDFRQERTSQLAGCSICAARRYKCCDLLVLFCGPLALAFFFNGVIFVANAAFNNMGHPFRSTWINWGRHTLGTVPLVWAGGMLYGAAGVLVGQALGGVIFAGVAAVMVRRMMRGKAGAPVPAEPFERQARLMSLMHRRR